MKFVEGLTSGLIALLDLNDHGRSIAICGENIDASQGAVLVGKPIFHAPEGEARSVPAVLQARLATVLQS